MAEIFSFWAEIIFHGQLCGSISSASLARYGGLIHSSPSGSFFMNHKIKKNKKPKAFCCGVHRCEKLSFVRSFIFGHVEDCNDHRWPGLAPSYVSVSKIPAASQAIETSTNELVQSIHY
jgi:hypothetical protein